MSGELLNGKRVRIDRTDAVDRYRFVCPAGHTSWDRTNSHGWCETCANAAKQGADVEPEFWEIYDKREDVLIPYERIDFVGEP